MKLTPTGSGHVGLGRLDRIDARQVWHHEALDFTPWLASHLDLLSEALGLDLEVTATEVDVGEFSVDIVAKDLGSGLLVVIENQLEKTDHSHLGQLLTYAAGQGAGWVVWIAPEFRDEHRQALDWLNAQTTEGLNFFGVEIELLQIDDSLPAPHFKVVAEPNEWAKASRSATSAPTELGLRYQRFFTAILERFKALRPHVTSTSRVGTGNWLPFSAGRSGFQFVWSVASGFRFRVELYIDVGDKDQNKAFFDQLRTKSAELEATLNEQIAWERLDEKRGCRLSIYRQADRATFDEDSALIEWAATTMLVFNDAIRPIIRDL